jgi:ATP-dependent Clp protease ATP-binding subunit ClpB
LLTLLLVVLQVLGRNLEGVVNAAMGIKAKMGDQFVSVEHLVLSLADDVRFGEALFKAEGLTAKKLEAAVKEVSCASGFRPLGLHS